jgi:hypothetical protein
MIQHSNVEPREEERNAPLRSVPRINDKEREKGKREKKVHVGCDTFSCED